MLEKFMSYIEYQAFNNRQPGNQESIFRIRFHPQYYFEEEENILALENRVIENIDDIPRITKNIISMIKDAFWGLYKTWSNQSQRRYSDNWKEAFDFLWEAVFQEWLWQQEPESRFFLLQDQINDENTLAFNVRYIPGQEPLLKDIKLTVYNNYTFYLDLTLLNWPSNTQPGYLYIFHKDNSGRYIWFPSSTFGAKQNLMTREDNFLALPFPDIQSKAYGIFPNQTSAGTNYILCIIIMNETPLNNEIASTRLNWLKPSNQAQLSKWTPKQMREFILELESQHLRWTANLDRFIVAFDDNEMPELH